MAKLNAQEREDALRRMVQQYHGEERNSANLDMDDLRAAVNAMDDFVDDNAAAINALFPEPFRSAAPLRLKALVLTYATMKRGGII